APSRNGSGIAHKAPSPWKASLMRRPTVRQEHSTAQAEPMQLVSALPLSTARLCPKRAQTCPNLSSSLEVRSTSVRIEGAPTQWSNLRLGLRLFHDLGSASHEI